MKFLFESKQTIPNQAPFPSDNDGYALSVDIYILLPLNLIISEHSYSVLAVILLLIFPSDE